MSSTSGMLTFDGCMYGLVATKGRDAGIPIQKPWRVACSPNRCLPNLLNKRCDGSHDHEPCQGQNTLLTQGYTPEIVNMVHRSIVQDIATMNKQNVKHHADGSLDTSSVTSYKGRSLLNIGIDEMDEAVAMIASA